MEKKSTICVIMSSYNGEKYLREQINSIINQSDVEVKLVVRDDGSQDNTVALLKELLPNSSKIIMEKNIGVANSFWRALLLSGEYDYYAWSDQDDIWDANKLKLALERIDNLDNKRPVLYFCGNRTINKEGEIISENIDQNPSITLGHALINSAAQGATMVFNNELRRVALICSPNFKKLNILHDAWLHKVCLAVNGIVVYDPRATLSYRIHENNVEARMPVKTTIFQKIHNKLGLRSPNYYSNIASELIKCYSKNIAEKDRNLIDCLAFYRSNKKYKVRLLLRNEISTGEIKRDIAYKINVLVNRA